MLYSQIVQAFPAYPMHTTCPILPPNAIWCTVSTTKLPTVSYHFSLGL